MEHNGPEPAKKRFDIMLMKKRLILEIRKYPNLYDSSHEAYRDVGTKDRSWLEISKAMHQNAEYLKREWKKLRDGFRQARRKSTANGSRCDGSWRFEKLMSFLVPFMTERTSGVRTVTRESDASDIVNEESNVSTNGSEERIDGESYDEMEQEIAEPLKTEATTTYWVQPAHSPALDETRAAFSQSDDLDLFFSSLCQSTRKLPRKYQNKIKKQLLEVVTKVEEDYYIKNNI